MSAVFAPDEPCDLWERLRRLMPMDYLALLADMLEEMESGEGFGSIAIVGANHEIAGMDLTLKNRLPNKKRRR